jgi:EAL domain-containing protein (putative c-di-GMP-specific phosphodiesterase class I)
VSVNVSAAQLLNTDLAADVDAILHQTRLPPPLLCLELTESVFAESSSQRVRSSLEALQGLGVELALDDFGTGYSSLSYLQNLPFMKVKIDRSFVAGIEKDLQKRGMLAGIIKLVHALDMVVVAEGAESEEQVRILADMGVEQAQGYALARPMEAESAIANAEILDEQFIRRFGPPRGKQPIVIGLTG